MAILSDLPRQLAFINQIGWPGFLIIGIVAVLLFGAKLPEIAKSLAQSFVMFRRTLKDAEIDLSKAGTPPEAPPPDLPPSPRAPSDATANAPLTPPLALPLAPASTPAAALGSAPDSAPDAAPPPGLDPSGPAGAAAVSNPPSGGALPMSTAHVILEDAGDRPDDLRVALGAMLGVPPGEAAQWTDRCPVSLGAGFPVGVAMDMKNILEAAGGRVSLK